MKDNSKVSEHIYFLIDRTGNLVGWTLKIYKQIMIQCKRCQFENWHDREWMIQVWPMNNS